jgi:hypothetical protein
VADGGDDEDDDTVTMSELFDSGEEMRQITTPRTIENLSKWLNKADPQQLSQYLQTPTQAAGQESTVLHEVVEAKVGNTLFATQVIAAIADDLASGAGSAQTSRVNVPQPNCYVGLKGATTVTDLADQIASLTDNERSASLLYALKENEDNSRLIEQLAQGMSQFEAEHTRTLFAMVNGQQFNRQNLEAFIESDTAVGNAIKPAVSAFL